MDVDELYLYGEITFPLLAHIDTTKKMLDLFVATGHNNSSKTCHPYLQSMEGMQQKHPSIFEQFLKRNYIIRRSENNWSGILSDVNCTNLNEIFERKR